MSDVLLIIPAYNEEKNIGRVLSNLILLDCDIDIVVINDGSVDDTERVVNCYNVPVISHIYNLGYGAALQTGFKYAKTKGYKYVIQFDADGQHDVNDIPSMVEKLKTSDTDIVVGSRFLGKGYFKLGFLKKIVISLMRFLIKLLCKTKVTDPTSGLKGLSERTYSYYSTMGNFPFDYPDADILIKMLRKNYRLCELPIIVKQRQEGKSMHSGLRPIVYLLKILLSILVIVLKEVAYKGDLKDG